MNIVYIDFDDIKNPLLGAGQGVATYNVGRELVKLGHSVTVYCSRHPGSKDRTDDGVVYKHIGLGSGNLLLNNAIFFVSAPLAVLSMKNTDIIIECFTAPVSTLLSPLFTKIPVVVLPSMFNASEFAKKYHLPFHLYERFCLRFYKYMMPYSTVDQNKALSINPRIMTKIIGQGVGPEFFEIPRETPKHILYFGRLDIHQKGIDLLLRSYKLISDEINFPLVVAGHGPDKGKIQELINNLGLSDKVSLIGPIRGKQKEDVLSHSAFVVFPSRHDEMCLASLEVLAAGIPLVCFDLPESTWIDGDVALKTKPFDESDYANKIKLMFNSRNYIGFGKAARQFARRYRWENVASEFASFFRTIIKAYD